MDKELKRLGIKIQDLIDAEEKMKGGKYYNVNWSKILKINKKKKKTA